jgi:predicted TIM-barrel fold metal-dependent hydrolase
MTDAAAANDPLARPVIDAVAFHEWRSSRDLLPFLSQGWQDLVLPPRAGVGAMHVTPGRWYENPMGDKADAAYPEEGPPGSDYHLLLDQLFGSGRRDRAVLTFDKGADVTAFGHVRAGMAFVQAINDWNQEIWLQRDNRLYGLVLVMSQVPEAAAAEIRRIGTDPKIVGIAMGLNGMGRMYGHPAYHTIYEAASDLDLPIVIQIGTEAATTSLMPPIAGGMPATYAEYHMMRMHGAMSHIVSMITEGVFGRFPNLKLMVVGTGAMWVPSYLWRLNYYHKRHHEMPWLKEMPSETFRKRVRIASNSLESPKRPEDLIKILSTLPWIHESLTYASGYPNRDYEEPEVQAARLPAEWHEAVFHRNAEEFFRWPIAAGQRVGQRNSADAALAG